MLDYSVYTVSIVGYGKCTCVFMYLPSGSRIFENAPLAERR